MRYLLALAAGLAAIAGAAHAQPSLDSLHQALRLTQGQERAWRDYQAAIAPDPQQQTRVRQAQMLLPTLPTPRRLALMRAEMQADMTAFDRDAQAVNAFYGQLNPDQQRTFDAQTVPTAADR